MEIYSSFHIVQSHSFHPYTYIWFLHITFVLCLAISQLHSISSFFHFFFLLFFAFSVWTFMQIVAVGKRSFLILALLIYCQCFCTRTLIFLHQSLSIYIYTIIDTCMYGSDIKWKPSVGISSPVTLYDWWKGYIYICGVLESSCV